ncbi:hypothetical protein BJF92_06840 [Rhizobium rhizosphaerae]|uniref:Gfo/Idh/MocA family oxidoreductase n=1 Tax=Xaviernesmea rhizosphaerae TaxID=1672749 RepID=A0A1Q9APF2_9HYPH|nr:Gfo/Idh/MocA family oxidoreductase [Xaviernesmea rhizosphaerae]OLP57235.1 hypothetical protein BJF92_06840 [Xaviernesmea rhizosphaerae]
MGLGKEQVRWGVIGAGEIGIAFAQDIAQTRHAVVTAITSRREDRARLYAERFGGLACLPDLDALLAEEAVDAVYIATPSSQHAEQTLRALSAGKPVLVEKPLAVSAAEAQAVLDRARQTGLFAMEALWTLFLPALAALRAHLRQGTIGRVKAVRGQLAYFKPEDPHSRFFSPTLGGGALLDLGIYLIALTLNLFGTPKAMTSRWQAAATGVDLCAQMGLAYDGFEAELACGFDRTDTNRYVIEGETGALIIDQPFIAAPRLFLSRYAGLTRELGAEGNGLAGRILCKLTALPIVPGLTRLDHRYVGNGLSFEIDAASQAILAGETRSGIMPLERSVEALSLLDRIRAQPPERFR